MLISLEQLQEEREQGEQRLLKLKKDINFYKTLEDEYEKKLNKYEEEKNDMM